MCPYFLATIIVLSFLLLTFIFCPACDRCSCGNRRQSCKTCSGFNANSVTFPIKQDFTEKKGCSGFSNVPSNDSNTQRGKMMYVEGLDARAFDDSGKSEFNEMKHKEGLDARAFEDDGSSGFNDTRYKEGLDARAFDDSGKSEFSTGKLMNNINTLAGKFANPKDFWANAFGGSSEPNVDSS